MMGQLEILSSSHVQFITLFEQQVHSIAAVPLTSHFRVCIYIYTNAEPKPFFLTQTDICWTFLHPIGPCMITHWTPLEMLKWIFCIFLKAFFCIRNLHGRKWGMVVTLPKWLSLYPPFCLKPFFFGNIP